MENPTIVVITDRNDLDGQLFGVFSLRRTCCANSRCRRRHAATCAPASQPARAASCSPPFRNSCRARTRTPSRCSPTAKYRGHRRRGAPHPVRLRAKLKASEGAEAGESQARYQVGYAQHLRDALPNATFVAFTGTPVSARTATPAPCLATTSTSTTWSRP